MKRIRYILLLFILVPGLVCFSQGNLSSLGFWHQLAFNGEISLEGLYRQQNSLIGVSEENQQSLYGIAGIKLHSSSYLWLPDLVLLDIDFEFNPETRNERYLTIPNRSEVRTLGKIGIRSTLFNNKPITIIPYYNYNQSYFNRENLTNVQSKSQQWGGIVLLKNRHVPLTLRYNDLKWSQKETETGRVFTNNRSTFEGRIARSFGLRDKNELIYGHDDYTYTHTALDTNRNVINRVNLNNQFFLDTAKNYNFNSRISYYNQEGTINFNRFDVNERILFNLPHNFQLSANYNYYQLKERTQNLIQNRVGADLSHELFLSLRSNVFIEYYRTRQTVYNESNVKVGIGFDYTKQIPFGRLNLSYHYFRHHLEMKGETATLQIVNEGHTLTDGLLEFLDRPNIDIKSVVIKDITGTIIYQQNFDYVLIERNNYIEIQRILGGLIPIGGSVLVDYVAIQPGSYQYDLNNHNVYAGLLLFDRLLEVYYRGRFQNYVNIKQTDYLTLNYFSQNIFGLRIEKNFVRGGIELDNYMSNIIPYRMIRYYLNLQGGFKNKILLSLNASLRDYKYIEENHQQLYGNISGRAVYTFKAQTRLELEVGYLRHKAFQMDLSMWTGRLEFSTVFHQLYLYAGIDFYSRNYTTSNFTLSGLFLRVTRKF
ncbi:MAG: hypothetical protein QNK30_05380 [Bacteroidales bacterium]|nr:hypothetical protein [Bacteroidales bacterium]